MCGCGFGLRVLGFKERDAEFVEVGEGLLDASTMGGGEVRVRQGEVCRGDVLADFDEGLVVEGGHSGDVEMLYAIGCVESRGLFHLTLPSGAVVLDLDLLGGEGDRGATARLADGGEDLAEGDFVFHTPSRTRPLGYCKFIFWFLSHMPLVAYKPPPRG